jgi:hypothetical protein
MHLTTTMIATCTLLATTATTVTASPFLPPPPYHHQTNKPTTTNSINPFYLITTSSPLFNANSSLLPSSTLLGLFDPYYQSTYLLRQLSAGYGSAPVFSLAAGLLTTVASGPHGLGSFVYGVGHVGQGQELGFVSLGSQGMGEGALGLRGGYLLSMDGDVGGWRVCVGELGMGVVSSFFLFFFSFPFFLFFSFFLFFFSFFPFSFPFVCFRCSLLGWSAGLI